MRQNAFLRSLVFAAAAAAALFAGVPLLAPILGARGAVRLLLLAGVALHLVWIAPSRARGLSAAALAGALGALLLALPLGVGATALAAAALLGVCRSGVLYRSRPARAWLFEGLLCAGGLALASFLSAQHPYALALPVWGFWLVQSAFFLVGGVAPRTEEHASEDPFERSRARILALLDHPD